MFVKTSSRDNQPEMHPRDRPWRVHVVLSDLAFLPPVPFHNSQSFTEDLGTTVS